MTELERLRARIEDLERAAVPEVATVRLTDWTWHGLVQGTRYEGTVDQGANLQANMRLRTLRSDDKVTLWRLIHLAQSNGGGPAVTVRLGGLIDRDSLDRLQEAELLAVV